MSRELPVPDGPELSPVLQQALDAVLRESPPTDAVERVIARAGTLEINGVVPPAAVLRPVHEESKAVHHAAPSMTRRRSRWMLAAAALSIGLLALVLLTPQAGLAFADVVQQVRSASTVTCAFTVSLGRGPAAPGRMLFADQRMRIEQFDGALIQISDFAARRALILDTHRKLSQELTLDEHQQQAFVNPVEQLRKALAADAQSLGEERISGKLTRVFRLPKVDLLGVRGDAELTVWADAATGLPARIVIRETDPKAESELRFEEFVWDQPIDEALFAMTAPADFQPGTIVLESAPPASEAPKPASIDPATFAAEGLLCSDRVPRRALWSPDGATVTALLTEPEDAPIQETRPHELRQWSAQTGEQLWTAQVGGAGALAMTPNGGHIVTVVGREVQILDAATGKISWTLTSSQRVHSAVCSPDGKRVILGLNEWGPGGRPLSGGAQVLDLKTGAEVRTITTDAPTSDVDVSPDGVIVATTSNDGPVRLWNVETGSLMRIIPGQLYAAFSPDGRTIAVLSDERPTDRRTGSVRIYDIHDGRLIRTLTTEAGGADSYLLHVAWSADGARIAATDWNGAVTVWNTATGDRMETFAEPGGVHVAVFSPDGARLAIGSEAKTLRLRTLATP